MKVLILKTNQLGEVCSIIDSLPERYYVELDEPIVINSKEVTHLTLFRDEFECLEIDQL